ncbi:MAG: virulence RhuM family protein [Akkermansia sp.]|nr:virulence RhuM family protein [Akkermansia sp.]
MQWLLSHAERCADRKKHLTEDELKALNNLVSGYFDFAELAVRKHRVMHM